MHSAYLSTCALGCGHSGGQGRQKLPVSESDRINEIQVLLIQVVIHPPSDRHLRYFQFAGANGLFYI